MKITAIKQQARRTDRYSIFVDGAYAFSLGESALLEQQLASGQELSQAQLSELRKVSHTDKIYANALRYVALRPRSEWEMRSYLERKKVEEPVANHIQNKLRHLGLLDDQAFARAWVSHRQSLKSVSQRRLIQELKQKRVAEAIIADTLHTTELDERQSLRILIAKKQARYPDKTKLMSYLARQGFRYDDIIAGMDEQNDQTP